MVVNHVDIYVSIFKVRFLFFMFSAKVIYLSYLLDSFLLDTV